MKHPISTGSEADKPVVDWLVLSIKNMIDDVGVYNHPSELREFGKEQIDISTEYEENIYSKANKDSFALFVNLVYCNPDLPNNQTIRITSLHGKYCKIYKNNSWVIEDYEKVMRRIAKVFFECFKTIDDEKFSEYLIFIYNVTLNRTKERKLFIRHTKQTVLPAIYNLTKRSN